MKTTGKITQKKKKKMVIAILIPLMLMMNITRSISPTHTLRLGHRVIGLFLSLSLSILTCRFLVDFVTKGLLICNIYSDLFVCFLVMFGRQSIDLYSSVPSPSIGFLGNNSMSRFGSSFLSSSLIRRHTPEYLPTVAKPLLEAEEQAPPPPKHRLSSHGLLPPVPPSRRSSMRKDERVSHEVPMSRNSSYGQAVMNGKFLLLKVVRVLCLPKSS